MRSNKCTDEGRYEYHHSIYPIFVVGVPRSGTTLLQAMLNSHPDIVIAPETHFFSKFWPLRYRFGSLSNPSNRNNLAEEYVKSKYFKDLQFNKEYSVKKLLSENATSYGQFFEILIREYMKKYPQKRICGEKTPAHLYFMEEIKKNFSNAVFIHLVRDPRAVAYSIERTEWGKNREPQQIAMRWIRCMKKADDFAVKYPDSLLEVYYRNLLQNPEKELKKISSFCSVDFHPSMLEYYKKPADYIGDGEEWKYNVQNPIDLSRINRWRTGLSEESTSLIFSICKDKMKEKGLIEVEATTSPWLSIKSIRFKILNEMRIVARKVVERMKNILFLV